MSVALNKINIAVDGLFERWLSRVFRGQYPLQPIYVERAVEKAITHNTKVFKSGVLPPSHLEINLNPDDYQDFIKIMNLFKKQIENSANNFIANEFTGQTIGSAKLAIIFKEDPDISKGCVAVRADHCESAYEEMK